MTSTKPPFFWFQTFPVNRIKGETACNYKTRGEFPSPVQRNGNKRLLFLRASRMVLLHLIMNGVLPISIFKSIAMSVARPLNICWGAVCGTSSQKPQVPYLNNNAAKRRKNG